MEVDSELDDYGDMLFLYLLCGRKKKKNDNKKDGFGRSRYISAKRNPWSISCFISRDAKSREMFFRYHRMTPDRFEHLLSLVKDNLTKKETHLRKPISARERLSVTLRYLATGESQQLLSFQYRLGRNTVSNIVYETSVAIFECLKETYLRISQILRIGKTYPADKTNH